VSPTALMLSGVYMLRHLGETDAGDRLKRAIAEVIREGERVRYLISLKTVMTQPQSAPTGSPTL